MVWSPSKVAVFRDEFFRFLEHCYINSKETGGRYCLAEGVYRSQTMLLDGVFDGLSNDIHDFKILKSRQLGITTLSRALSMFWIGVHDGLQGAMIFDIDSNKENSRRELEAMIEELPARANFPRIKARNRYGIILSNGSKLQFMSAGVRNNRSSGILGRSSGLNFVHASECCSWENQEGIVSLEQSLAEDYENRLYLWESTARGFNQWYKMWNRAKTDSFRQKAIFIGWWAKNNQQITYGTPDFDKYGDAPPTPRELQRIQDVKARYGWVVTPEQLAWVRRKTDPDMVKEDDDAEDGYVLQDQPWVEDDAFIQTGSSFFDPVKLSNITRLHNSEKFKGYHFWPGERFIDMDIRPARLMREVQFKVWEEPDPDAFYVVAADPAYGHDENNDNSALQVMKCYADKIEQVAEFGDSTVQTFEFAWIIAAICGWYKNVTLIIEINGPGEAVWREYNSLRQVVQSGHQRQEAKEKGLADMFNNVRNYIYSRSDSMGVGHNLHWKTTGQLKVAIMERLRDFVMNGTMYVRSMDSFEEMRTITRDGDKIAAQNSDRDDRVFTLAMAARAWEEKLVRMLVAQGKTRERETLRKQASPSSQFQLMTQHQMEQFFKKKLRARLAAQSNSWRRR